MKLRPYQREAIDRVRDLWDSGDPNALVVLATGLGKTILFTTIGKELRNEGLRRILVLAHRDELIEQARDKWLKVDPTENVGIYKGPVRDLHADVIVASVQSCYGDVYRNLACECTQGPVPNDPLTGWPGKPEKRPASPGCPTCEGEGTVRTFVRPGRVHELPLDEIDLVVVDECHHITRDSQYVQILQAIREKNPACLHMGVTATPFRADKRGFGFIYNGAAYTMGLKRGIDEGYLAPTRCERVVLQIDLSQVRTSKATGDFIEKDLGDVMDTSEARSKIVEAWTEHAGPGTYPGDTRGRLTVAFSPTVESAKHLAEAFQEAGVAADWICGDKKLCPVERRKAVLASYERGDTRVIVNVGVLTEGWDVPATSCVLGARPTKSKGLAFQMVGRGTRLLGLTLEESIANGKPDCLVLDVVGMIGADGLRSLADLSDEDPAPKKKRAQDAEEEQPEDGGEQLEFPDEVTTRRVVGYSSFEVDLFGGGVDWCRINSARVAGMTAGRTMVVFPSGPGVWSAVCTGRKVTIVAEDLPEREAMKLAETYALENGEKNYLQPGRWFAERRASDKQRALVARLLPYNQKGAERPDVDRLSMQQASAWVGYLSARRTYLKHLETKKAAEDGAAAVPAAADEDFDPFAEAI